MTSINAFSNILQIEFQLFCFIQYIYSTNYANHQLHTRMLLLLSEGKQKTLTWIILNVLLWIDLHFIKHPDNQTARNTKQKQMQIIFFLFLHSYYNNNKIKLNQTGIKYSINYHIAFVIIINILLIIWYIIITLTLVNYKYCGIHNY